MCYVKFHPLTPETMVSAYETNALLRLEESFTQPLPSPTSVFGLVCDATETLAVRPDSSHVNFQVNYLKSVSRGTQCLAEDGWEGETMIGTLYMLGGACEHKRGGENA
jgi:hypothetical protein